MTSHDVVAKIRRTLSIKKVGHAGTLDPLATGVLVVCLGPATRLSEYAMASTKQYRARVHLGITTETYDSDGAILTKQEAGHITQEQVEHELRAFIGNIEQLPPMYSAIKQQGRKLYEIARAGETVERKPRPVTIDSLIIREWIPPQFVLDISCSAGTYVRSLAQDLGEALGVGAHLAGLVRIASGTMKLDDAVPLTTLLNEPNWQRHVLTPDSVLTNFPVIYLGDADTQHVRHGRPVSATISCNADLARGYTSDGRFVAILKSVGEGLWQPRKVFLTQF
jgi:tRNA pseudouridine55 synthase